MKFTKLQLILALMVSVLMFNACKDDPVNPTDDTASYFQFKAGNYWVYKTDTLDFSNKVVSTLTDSTVDIGIITQFGKTTNKLTSYCSDNSIKDDYFSVDGNKLFNYIDSISFNSLLSLQMAKWFLISDFNATNWTVLDSNISISLTLGTLNGNLKILGSKGIQKNINVGSSSISCQEFIQTITVKGQVTTTFGPIAVDQTLNLKYYLAKNVGIVQVSREAAKLTVPIVGDIILNGFIRTLLRYKIS